MRFLLVALLCALSYAQTDEVIEVSEDETVRLLDGDIPEILYLDKWVPICSHGFDYNGASNFCRKLGYLYGHIKLLREPYERDSLQIGRCALDESLTKCSWGLNSYVLGGEFCDKSKNVSMSITCSIRTSYSEPFADYKQYHRDVTSRLLAQKVIKERTLIFVCRSGVWQGKPNRGLSDHTTGLIGLFLFAMIHNLIFYIDCPFFKTVWAEPNIQWYLNLTQIHHNHVDVDWLQIHGVRVHIRIGDLKKRTQSNLVTSIRSNRGIILTMLQQWPKRTQHFFRQNSLTVYNVFQKLHDFLFRPTSRVLDLVSEFPQRPASIPMALIQIRAGDDCIEEGYKACEWRLNLLTRRFLTCAIDLEKRLNTELAWYLMSDNVHVKRYVHEHYAFKRQVIIPHFNISHDFVEYFDEDTVSNLIAEITFGRDCDYFIITKRSGLGRQIAFRSGKEKDHTWYGATCEKIDIPTLMADYSMI